MFGSLASYSGEASAFNPAAMPALQRSGSTAVCMAGGAAPAAAPPSKGADAFDPKALLRVPWRAGSESGSKSGLISSSMGTQSPPPANLPLPKAKLEAAAVNKMQWGVGGAAGAL